MSIVQTAELALLHLISFVLALVWIVLAVLIGIRRLGARALHRVRTILRRILPIHFAVTLGRTCTRPLVVLAIAVASPFATLRASVTTQPPDRLRKLEAHLRAELRAAEAHDQRDAARVVGRMLEVLHEGEGGKEKST